MPNDFFNEKKNYMSALLHALASLSTGHQQDVGGSPALLEEEALPMTLYLCQWNAPCKWKERAMLIPTFRKHVYAMQQQHELKPIEDLYTQNYIYSLITI